MERQQIKKVFDLHLKSLSWDKNDPIQKAMYLRLIDATELIVKNCSIPAVVGRSEQLQNNPFCANKKQFNCSCVGECMNFAGSNIL